MTRLLFAFLLFAAPVIAGESCPADRPVERDVIDYSQPFTCNTNNPPTKLVCPKDDHNPVLKPPPCYYMREPPCRPQVSARCFTKQEIDEAEKHLGP